MESSDAGVAHATSPLVVTISDDGLSATLQVLPPKPGGNAPPPTLEDALASLATAQVRYGLNQQRVRFALRTPGQPIVVARGKAPLPGEDGRVVFAANLVAGGGQPHVDADGRASLIDVDLDLVRAVGAGDVLATLTAPTAGTPGVSVRGEPITPRPGKPARLRPGPGARLSEDGDQVLAAVAGHAALVDDTIIIADVYCVRGDVGPRTGHIDFVGSVRVAGNVGRGFRVKAGGAVEIHGSLAGGDVEAGGSVSVGYGIQGRDGHGRVRAAGTVRAKFIEFATVRAGGNVYASDGIVHSSVQAGAVVEVLGSHGSIVGGRVAAREVIKARELGSPRGIPTEVRVGADDALVAEARQVRTRATELKEQLDRVQRRLAQLQVVHRQGRLNALGRHELLQVHAAYRVLLEERTAVATRHQAIIQRLRALPGAVVIVAGTCHPGVRVSIWHGDAHHRRGSAGRPLPKEPAAPHRRRDRPRRARPVGPGARNATPRLGRRSQMLPAHAHVAAAVSC